MKKKGESRFLGRTFDGRKVGILATVGNPFVDVAVQGHGVRQYPVKHMENLGKMKRMTAENFYNCLY